MHNPRAKRVNSQQSEPNQVYLLTKSSSRPLSSSRFSETGRMSRTNTTRDSFNITRRASSFRVHASGPQNITTTEPSARYKTQSSMDLGSDDEIGNKLTDNNLASSTLLNLEAPKSSTRNSATTSSLLKITAHQAKLKKYKDPRLINIKREENLQEIMNQSNINPERVNYAETLDERELALQKLLLKQVNDQLLYHLQHQQRRDEDRSIALKDYERNPNDRDLLFKKLEIDTKYKALKTKLLEKIVDNDFLKIHKEDRVVRSKKRSAKLNLYHLKGHIGMMNETKMRVVNTDKTAAIYDVRDYSKAIEAIDEAFTDRIIEKVATIADKHAIDFNEVYKTKAKRASVDQRVDESEFQKVVTEDPEQVMWDRYFRENFPLALKDERTEAIKHICYHPKELGENYNKFITLRAEREREKEKLVRSQSAAAVKRASVNASVTDLPKEPVEVLEETSKHRKERFKTEATLRREHVPEVLNTIQKVNKEVEERYKSVYQAVQWNAVHEEVFLENRQDSLKSLPIGSFGAANAITTLGFYNNNQFVRAERDKIDKKQSEAKNSFYFLNNNASSRKKIQNELDLIIDDEIDKIEFEISNHILEKFHNDQQVVFAERRKYLESIQVQRRVEDRGNVKIAKRRAAVEEGKKVQKFYTAQVKALMKRREEGLITKADDRFSKSHVIQDCKDSYSKLSNLRKILENLRNKKHILEVMSKIYDPEARRAASVQPVKRKRAEKQNPEFRKSLTRSYSGGPIAKKKAQRHHTEQKKHEAAILVQKHVRGMIARRKVQEFKDMRAWLSTKFMQSVSASRSKEVEEVETKETLKEKASTRFTRLAKRPSLIARTIDQLHKKLPLEETLHAIEGTRKEMMAAEEAKKLRRKSFSETNIKLYVPNVLSRFAAPDFE